jgi:6-phosphofructokinase 1
MRPNEEGEYRLGGIGDIVAREIAARTGKETRCTVLGHLQRGGAAHHARPDSRDPLRGKGGEVNPRKAFGSMVSYQNYQVRTCQSLTPSTACDSSPPDGELCKPPATSEISFGD